MMAEESPPPTPPPASRTDRLISLVAGISTWKQAMILVVLGFALLGGVLLYQHPEWVGARVLAPATRQTLVPTEQMTRALPTLRRELDAEVVFVLGAAPERNECWVLAYDASPDSAAVVEELAAARATTKLPLFAESPAWNMGIIGVLDGTVPCIPTGELAETELVRRTGIVEVCLVGLPPGPEGLLGLLAAGFREPRNRPARTHVRNALQSAALQWMHH